MSLRSVGWLVGLVGAGALLGAPARASQVRPINIEEMTGRAARIFAGRCVEVQTTVDPAFGHEVTLATFEVDRVVKGSLGRTISVRMPGGDDASGGTAGMPLFRPGEEVVLFLYGESEMGFSSPVGLGQGRFSVVTDKQGRRIALNGLVNRNLLRALTPEARTRLGGSFETWKDRKDLEPAALLDMAEALAAPPRAPPSAPSVVR